MTQVSIEKFGKDHWTTFAYIETRCVDHKGAPDKRHMRCDQERHPAHAVNAWVVGDGKEYPTRLKGGVELHDHDDWDCVDDLEAVGLLETHGTGLHPVFVMTDAGMAMISRLRAHKAAGGQYGDFDPTSQVVVSRHAPMARMIGSGHMLSDIVADAT